MEPTAANRVVVGVDESPGSAAALDWALREAALRGARLQVVHSWHVPHLVSLVEVGTTIDDGSWFEKVAQESLDRTVEAALDRAGRPDVDVERVLVGGDSAAAIIDWAKGADLLVVGTRGRGGFKGLMLGSVSMQVVQHAPCPVVVVPG